MIELKPHEEIFNLKPIGIKYICEFCNEGEMIHDANEPLMVELAIEGPKLFKHHCTKCGKVMHLPKVYPYIEWIPESQNN